MSKGPFRPIYLSLLHNRRFMVLSVDARSLWLAFKLRLGPSGLDRVYREELCEITSLDVDRLDAAIAELEANGWLEVEGGLYWMVNGYANEPMNQGKARKAVARHLDGLRGPIVDKFRIRYGFVENQGLSDRLSDRLCDSPVRDRDRDRENHNQRDREVSPASLAQSIVENSTGRDSLRAWLGTPEAVRRAASLWDRNTPDWPHMLLTRYGPDGTDPKPQAVRVARVGRPDAQDTGPVGDDQSGGVRQPFAGGTAAGGWTMIAGRLTTRTLRYRLFGLAQQYRRRGWAMPRLRTREGRPLRIYDDVDLLLAVVWMEHDLNHNTGP